MLKKIYIKDFALINSLEIDFATGFTVLTGETGAGKSILIQAISLLTGENSNEDLIKKDAHEAIIEGIFEIKQELITERLRAFIGSDNELILLRKITRGKGSVVKINNESATLKKLKEITKDLISITNQFEHLSLFNADTQLDLIDTFNPTASEDKSLLDLKAIYQSEFARFNIVKHNLEQVNQDTSQTEAKLEFLNFQIQDLETQNFQLNEEEELNKRLKEIKYLKTITEGVAGIKNSFNIISQELANAKNFKDKLAKLENPFYEKLFERVNTFELDLQDILIDLQKEEVLISEINEEDLNQIEERLDLIFRYKKKYKVDSVLELCAFLKKIKMDYQDLSNQSLNKDDLEKEFIEIKNKLTNFAKSIHDLRVKRAEKITELVIKELKDLHFKHVSFQINIQSDIENFSTTGFDKVNFLISLNPGEDLKPIEKVASGGELSRILLALKSIFSENSSITTLVFDEIDTGIGGITALKVGEKMRLISKKTQVIAVTHLAQIAKFANQHLVIEKEFNNNQTIISINEIFEENKNLEIARMIGGKEIVEIIK